MRTLLRRLFRETDGSHPLYYALAGGGVTAVFILRPALLANGLDGLALLVRSAATQMLSW